MKDKTPDSSGNWISDRHLRNGGTCLLCRLLSSFARSASSTSTPIRNLPFRLLIFFAEAASYRGVASVMEEHNRTATKKRSAIRVLLKRGGCVGCSDILIVLLVYVCAVFICICGKNVNSYDLVATSRYPPIPMKSDDYVQRHMERSTEKVVRRSRSTFSSSRGRM